MLKKWLQDEDERRVRLLDSQGELEDYCEKTDSKWPVKTIRTCSLFVFIFACVTANLSFDVMNALQYHPKSVTQKGWPST